jgi:intraflagellar transport protein 46
MLKESGIPTADFDCDISTYVDICCALLDIPVYKSRIQSLHVLFSLYSAFKNSQHFNQLAQERKATHLSQFHQRQTITQLCV